MRCKLFSALYEFVYWIQKRALFIQCMRNTMKHTILKSIFGLRNGLPYALVNGWLPTMNPYICILGMKHPMAFSPPSY